MKFIKIDNYECGTCGCKEYDVIDLEIPLIICAECGSIHTGEYEEIED
jgi:uncharacterized Zn finger protein